MGFIQYYLSEYRYVEADGAEKAQFRLATLTYATIEYNIHINVNILILLQEECKVEFFPTWLDIYMQRSFEIF